MHSNKETICFQTQQKKEKKTTICLIPEQQFVLAGEVLRGNSTHSIFHYGVTRIWIFNGGTRCNLDARQPHIN